MSRRAFFIIFFLLFTVGVVWYATAFVKIPETSFSQAAGIDDHQKKVIVSGQVLDQATSAEGKTLTFYMKDAEGTESKIFYDGQELISKEQIDEARAERRRISVAGHVCGDRFHSKGITIH